MGYLAYPASLLPELKQPLGQTIDIEAEGPKRLLRLLDLMRPSMLLTVGDAVTNRILSLGLNPRIIVADGRVMRLPTQLTIPKDYTTLHLDNPAGKITSEAWEILGKALSMKTPVAVMVRGEEDLLVLPLVVLSPADAVLFYGQPREGTVLVKCDAATKDRVNNLLSRFISKN